MEQTEDPMLDYQKAGTVPHLQTVGVEVGPETELTWLRERQAVYEAEQLARRNRHCTVAENNAYVAIEHGIEAAWQSRDSDGFVHVNLAAIAAFAGTSEPSICDYVKRFDSWGLVLRNREGRRAPLKGKKGNQWPNQLWLRPRPGTLIERLTEYASFDPKVKRQTESKKSAVVLLSTPSIPLVTDTSLSSVAQLNPLLGLSSASPENRFEEPTVGKEKQETTQAPSTGIAPEETPVEARPETLTEFFVWMAGTSYRHIEMMKTGDNKYVYVNEPITPELAHEHLAGVRYLGADLTHDGGKAALFMFDADTSDNWELAQQQAEKLWEAGARVWLEISPHRGGHIGLIFKQPVPIADAFATIFKHAPRLKDLECFPSAGGKAVRLPCGFYERTFEHEDKFPIDDLPTSYSYKTGAKSSAWVPPIQRGIRVRSRWNASWST